MHDCKATTPFPADTLYKSLGIEPRLNDAEISQILQYGYQGRYTNLVLSLLYPDRDWKDAVFHEDHIFPQSEFQVRPLRKRGYNDGKIQSYQSKYNVLANHNVIICNRLQKRAEDLSRSRLGARYNVHATCEVNQRPQGCRETELRHVISIAGSTTAAWLSTGSWMFPVSTSETN